MSPHPPPCTLFHTLSPSAGLPHFRDAPASAAPRLGQRRAAAERTGRLRPRCAARCATYSYYS
eukprot:scaffold21406_cov39-Phaeocystis_antarctica.AAC.1